MSQLGDNIQEQLPGSQENHLAESPELISFLQDNFSKVFSLLAPLISFSIQNENHIRQIWKSLNGTNYKNGTSNRGLGVNHENKEDSNTYTSDPNVEPMAGTSTRDQFKIRLNNQRKRKISDTVVNVDSRIIHCSDCEQNFQRGDGSYTRHLKEMKCKPHKCIECDKKFIKKSYLATHMSTHYMHTGEAVQAAKMRRVDQDVPKTVENPPSVFTQDPQSSTSTPQRFHEGTSNLEDSLPRQNCVSTQNTQHAAIATTTVKSEKHDIFNDPEFFAFCTNLASNSRPAE